MFLLIHHIQDICIIDRLQRALIAVLSALEDLCETTKVDAQRYGAITARYDLNPVALSRTEMSATWELSMV